MTEKQLEKLGFHRIAHEMYEKYFDGRYVLIRVQKSTDERYFWNALYDAIYEIGEDDGRRNKAWEVRKALNIEEI